ncbi:hypothetical protein I4U23_017111 [Adineta vaga]|nr:hypothetical protein I4U23_017111 [Adineta vaga]
MMDSSQLKYFSLISYGSTYCDNDLIIPFIQKMSYLQELRLVISVSREDTNQIVNGNNLYTDILIYLSELKSFRFSIYTYISNRNVSIDNFPSNDDIKQSFDYNRFGKEDNLQLSKEAEKLELITFTRLFELRVALAHMDYVEQLLFNRYTHLPRLRQLQIKYNQLITLTNNFTNDEKQFNCLQVQHLMINECFVRPQNFSLFFPLL